MKKYITPAVEVQTVTLCNMIAESFKVSDTTTTDQLSRDFVWEDWSEDED